MNKWLGVLFFVVGAAAVVFIAGPAGATLIEVTPTYGAAVIDGNIGEWNLTTDVNIPMYNQGNPAKPVEAHAYLRYDYAHQIMNVLVLQNGYPGNAGSPYLLNSFYAATNAFAYYTSKNNKIYADSNPLTYPPNSTLPNLAWVPAPVPTVVHSVGYEAAFSLALSSLNSLYDTAKFVVHVEWDANFGGTPTGGSAGSEGFANKAANEIVLHLPPPQTSPAPLPATVLLFGTGLVGLVGIRRKLK